MRDAACCAEVEAAAAADAPAPEGAGPLLTIAEEEALGCPAPSLSGAAAEVGGPGRTIVRWADLKVWTMPGWDKSTECIISKAPRMPSAPLLPPPLEEESRGGGVGAAAPPLLCLPELEALPPPPSLPLRPLLAFAAAAAAAAADFGVSGAPPLPWCEPPPQFPADVFPPARAAAPPAAAAEAGPRCGITLTATGAPFQMPL